MRYGIEPENLSWIETAWQKCETKVAAECSRLGPIMPYQSQSGHYSDMGEQELTAWTNGFYGGILWQMYHATGRSCYQKTAHAIGERLAQALQEPARLDHDVGFLFLPTAVAEYRLCHSEKARAHGLHAAALLAARYNPAGRYIRAWNGERAGIAIIDCLMNLPLLYWASEQTNDLALRQIAVAHTDTALACLLRPDGSCCHQAEFDPAAGTLLGNPGGQGYAAGSAWSRGQAWGIYGMSLAYRYTKKPEYLDAAKRIAHYFCANLALNDFLPLLDFRAPDPPHYLDTTAGVCAACGLLELAEHVPALEKGLYVRLAMRCIRAVTDRCCDWRPETDGIVLYGSARYDRAKDREVPLIYGDYFLLEALLRLLDRDFLIW